MIDVTTKPDKTQETYVSSTGRSGAPDTEHSSAIPGVVAHRVNRLVIEVAESFDGFRERYERAAPEMGPEDLVDLIDRQAPWSSVLADADTRAPHGFIIYFSADVTPLMALAGDRGRCVIYLMGNHTIAERMYRHDPAAMLYAPLRTALCTGADGRTRFIIDQPSTEFSSFGVPEITAVGVELDRKLVGLLEALGAPVPAGLRES
jgi:hypothetical protein